MSWNNQVSFPELTKSWQFFVSAFLRGTFSDNLGGGTTHQLRPSCWAPVEEFKVLIMCCSLGDPKDKKIWYCNKSY